MSKLHRPLAESKSRIFCDLDLTKPGKRFGDLRLKYSDNRIALGCVLIPIGMIENDQGPTVLITGGVHGDEFEGPVAVLKLLHKLKVSDVKGRIIGLPALNAPALQASARVSPLDDGNLNRAFPGDPNGTPTQMIADFVENSLMPMCDAVIDLHSGGKSAWFSPCTMAVLNDNRSMSKTNLELAEIFGSRYIWLMGELNDDRSVNFAALRNEIPMIAAELGGGGQISPEPLAVGEQGIRNCLNYLGVLSDGIAPRPEPPIYFEITHHSQHIYSPHRGLFEPTFEPGDIVSKGDVVGYIHDIERIENSPTCITFPQGGVAVTRCHRGFVERGEQLAIAGSIADRPEFQ